MALTISFILTYSIIQYIAYFKRHVHKYEDVTTKSIRIIEEDRKGLHQYHGTDKRKRKPIAKRTILPAQKGLIIRPSDVNVSRGIEKKTKPIATDATKNLSVWKYLKTRRLFKRKYLRKSILNLFMKANRQRGNVSNSHEDHLT